MYFGGLALDGYLYRFNRNAGTFENLSKPLENATGIVVNDMAFGKNDTIWLGTGDGVMIYTPAGIAKADWYKSAWGPVHAIAAFPDGRIWVGCKPGLVEYKYGALNILDQSSGLASNFINYRSIAVSKDGQAFVATSEGTSFIASSYVASSLTPKPFITAVESGGRSMKPSEVQALPSGSYLLLQFVVPAYPAQHQEYQYRLSANDAWSPSFVKPEIALHQLRAGKYELQIRARQKGGYQWSKPAVFAFTVKLPWHKQWWAYLLFVLGGLGIIWAAVRINTIRLKKEKERLEKIIGDRTKEIWQKNQALETQKEEIQIQNAALQSQKEEIQAQNEELIQLTEEIASQRDKIEIQNRLLSEQHARTTDSIRYAQQIQQSILPTPERMASVFADYFTLYRPKDIVSGDFYWLAQREEAVYLAVADCTGHGVPGAFMSMIGSRILNEVVMEQQHEAPADILEVIDAHMREALQQNAHREGGVTDGMDLALCRICRLADGTTEVRFAGAKNHLFYLSNGTLHRLKGSKRSIGGNLATAHHFEESRIVLQTNDVLYLATDGFADQSNEQRQKLGTPQLIQLIESHSNAPMHVQKQQLEHVLQAFKGNAEQRDDITVLGIRI
jgi:serine phosphatase RsbU (regulator of sigma subunit)